MLSPKSMNKNSALDNGCSGDGDRRDVRALEGFILASLVISKILFRYSLNLSPSLMCWELVTQLLRWDLEQSL